MRVLFLAALAAMTAAELVQLHQPSVVPKGWRVTSQGVDTAQRFRVVIGMKRSNQDRLEKLVDQVSNPQGAQYLQYPTYEEVGDLVRPSAANTAVVRNWLSQHGVTDIAEHPHGDYIHILATAEQLETMSGGKFTGYTHDATGAVIHRVTSGVNVPAEVAAVIDTFGGFSGFPLAPVNEAKPVGVAQTGAVNPPVFRETYNVTNVTKSGKTNIQAIAQFQGQYVSDTSLSSFCEQFDPSSAPCKIAKYIGPDQSSQPGLESMLDTEYITSLGKQTTWVYSYTGMDFCNDLIQFISNATSENPHPYVISVSYGSQKIDFCEASLITRFAQDVQKAAGLGITVLISSGDDGSGHNTRQGTNTGKLSPSYPASVPYATAVGATYWVKGTSGPETATTQFGSGGGFSYDFPAPAWQTSQIATYLSTVDLPTTNAYAKTGRGSPDVSALGESFTVLVGSQIYPLAGTSASSPSVAALVTLLNEVCLSASGKPLGFVNPLFYQNPSAFRDVTVGTNAIQQPEGWAAIKGWDAATGLGTPDFSALLKVVQKGCASAARDF